MPSHAPLNHRAIDLATLTPAKVVSICDHAILHPQLTDAQILADLDAIKSLPLASVCIKPYAVAVARRTLAETKIGIGTVIGFPHGSPVPAAKALETEQAFRDGATEADMVINVGKALSHDWAYCRADISAVLEVVRRHGGVIKVIFETDYLTDDAAKIRLCEICTELGVDYVKTSTGFGFAKQPDGSFQARGAQDADLKLMRKHAGPNVGVKASGGVRTLQDAARVIALGVTRIGTSSSVAMYNATLATPKLGGLDTGY
jgi:deoxyribose-phosphate aldolase